MERNKEIKKMRKIYSAGFLLFKTTGEKKYQFLLLKKYNLEIDLPKGHLEFGETALKAAIRELGEETGITDNYIIDDNFIFENIYYPYYKRFNFYRKDILIHSQNNRFQAKVEKKLTVHLGKLLIDRPLIMSEHLSSQWLDYNPPHTFTSPSSLNQLFEKVLDYQKEGKLDAFLERLN